jgi:hypothetical protein
VELGEKLPKSEVEARKFRAKLLGLIYEDLLEAWFKLNGYTVVGKTVRKGLYKGKRTAVNFVLEKKESYMLLNPSAGQLTWKED